MALVDRWREIVDKMWGPNGPLAWHLKKGEEQLLQKLWGKGGAEAAREALKLPVSKEVPLPLILRYLTRVTLPNLLKWKNPIDIVRLRSMAAVRSLLLRAGPGALATLGVAIALVALLPSRAGDDGFLVTLASTIDATTSGPQSYSTGGWPKDITDITFLGHRGKSGRWLPNPNNLLVRLTTDPERHGMLAVFDSSGHVVYSVNGYYADIDLRVSRGTYTLRAYDGGGCCNTMETVRRGASDSHYRFNNNPKDETANLFAAPATDSLTVVVDSNLATLITTRPR